MDTTDYFRAQARECRQHADGLAASRDRDGLLMLARHYEAEAKRAAAGIAQPALRTPGLTARAPATTPNAKCPGIAARAPV